uniref:Uncharacterized protein n=1 Tax=Anopheles dirus TaxID=7168 RepID=A0A182NXC5_9DIPT
MNVNSEQQRGMAFPANIRCNITRVYTRTHSIYHDSMAQAPLTSLCSTIMTEGERIGGFMVKDSLHRTSAIFILVYANDKPYNLPSNFAVHYNEERRKSCKRKDDGSESKTPYCIVFDKVHHHEPNNSIFSVFAETHHRSV